MKLGLRCSTPEHTRPPCQFVGSSVDRTPQGTVSYPSWYKACAVISSQWLFLRREENIQRSSLLSPGAPGRQIG